MEKKVRKKYDNPQSEALRLTLGRAVLQAGSDPESGGGQGSGDGGNM